MNSKLPLYADPGTVNPSWILSSDTIRDPTKSGVRSLRRAISSDTIQTYIPMQKEGGNTSAAFLLYLIKSQGLKIRLFFSHAALNPFQTPSMGRNNTINWDDFYRLIGAHLPIVRVCVPVGQEIEWGITGCWRDSRGMARSISFVKVQRRFWATKGRGRISSPLVSWPTNRAFKWKPLIPNNGLGAWLTVLPSATKVVSAAICWTD